MVLASTALLRYNKTVINPYLLFTERISSPYEFKYEKENKESLYYAQKNNDVSKLVEVFTNCQNRLDKKLSTYNNTPQLVKKEIATNNK